MTAAKPIIPIQETKLIFGNISELTGESVVVVVVVAVFQNTFFSP
jgi:hypothetical protein